MVLCDFRKYRKPPRKVIGNSEGEGGLKRYIFEIKKGFPEGGIYAKIPSVMGVWIFTGRTHFELKVMKMV